MSRETLADRFGIDAVAFRTSRFETCPALVADRIVADHGIEDRAGEVLRAVREVADA